MFHIGKVTRVIGYDKGNISKDKSTQAAIYMWDENLIILDVDKKLGGKIKENKYVLADYTPMSAQSINRKMKIIKILDDKLGKKLYDEFVESHEKRKQKNKTQPSQEITPMPYIR